MRPVVPPHEEDVGDGEDDERTDQIDPVDKHEGEAGKRGEAWAAPDEAEGNQQLEGHIHQLDYNVAETELIRHQLIRVLPVGLTEVFVQQNPMDDRHTQLRIGHQYRQQHNQQNNCNGILELQRKTQRQIVPDNGNRA